MAENTPIIDVTPIAHSSTRKNAPGASQTRSAAQSSHGTQSHSTWSSESRRQGQSTTRDSAFGFGVPFGAASKTGGSSQRSAGESVRWTPVSALGGIAQIVIGAGLVAVGVPMLVLPGPGLLAIAAGAMLVARGFRKVRPSF